MQCTVRIFHSLDHKKGQYVCFLFHKYTGLFMDEILKHSVLSFHISCRTGGKFTFVFIDQNF